MGDLLDGIIAPPAKAETLLWCPEFLCDETTPEPRAAPDDWILRPPESAGAACAAWAVGESMDEGEHRLVHVGETLDFVFYLDFGRHDIVVLPDGTFQGGSAIDDRASHFMFEGDSDTLSLSLESFCESYAENSSGLIPEDGESVAVFAYHWSDPVAFRLCLSDNGKPVFERVAVEDGRDRDALAQPASEAAP